MERSNSWSDYHHRTTTMNRRGSWNRHQYPVQSSKMDPAPKIPEHEQLSNKAPVSQLPKYIHAVEDAEKGPKSKNKPPGRNIIICLDGTGDRFDADNSNIVHIVSCLKKDDPNQVTYYQSGIGTYDGGGLKNGFSAALDMAVGSGLGVHVQDAYHFLMQTYREGDRICIFGFSRGAYTARCLAGMLHKVGLLPAHNISQVQFAYQFYKDDSDEGWQMSADFKKTFCIDCSVYFVGVFDCVASVGFVPRKLPFSSTPTSRTGHFRHAMALDEHRAKFKCCHWQRKDGTEYDNAEQNLPYKPATNGAQTNGAAKGTQLNGAPKAPQPNGTTLTRSATQIEKEKEKAEAEKNARDDVKGTETDVLEVWFMGCHADVGGGAVKNEVRHKLSNIPLRWMLRQTFECNTGIIYDTAKLAEVGLDVHTLYPMYTRLRRPVVGPPPSMMEKYKSGTLAPIQKRSSALEPNDDDEQGVYNIKYLDDGNESSAKEAWVPEQVEDHFDAESEMNDQLVVAKGWWVLEYWPIKYRVQKKDSDAWEKVTGVNRGRFRAIQEPNPNLHWTVHHRMLKREYKMRGRMGRNSVARIVV